MNRAWPWLPLILLGAYHGLNPAMGWLFALARGLQEKNRAALLSALLPIALGHAVAIALALLALIILQGIVPYSLLKILIAGVLFAFAVTLLLRARHPKGAGMRMGWWGLGWWSFLMASSHGAGLMVIPVLITHAGHNMTRMDMPSPPPKSMPFLLAAILVHTASLLAVAAVLALVLFETYEKSGLVLLRRAWFNFDLLWGCALLLAALAALLM